MIDCIEETGKVLNTNNQGIVKYLCGIEEERNTLENIIAKQYQERKRIESDIERLTYKLCLINKSLAMRIKAKNNYDKTIEEIKAHYDKLVDSSNKLRQIVEQTQTDLDSIMNKKIGTGVENDEIKMLYMKSEGPKGPDDCVCAISLEVPTKEKPQSTKIIRNSLNSEKSKQSELSKNKSETNSTTNNEKKHSDNLEEYKDRFELRQAGADISEDIAIAEEPTLNGLSQEIQPESFSSE